MAPQGRAACAHLLPDTSPHQIMTEATTTDHRHATALPTMGALRPDTVHHAPLDTSPRARPFTARPGPHTEAVGVVLRPGTVWRATGLSMSATTSTSGTTSLPLMSKASPKATRTRMGGILTHTHAHLGLPATGPLLPLTLILAGCPTATAHLHLPHIDGDHQGRPRIRTTGPPMPEGPARAYTNLIARRTRMTGASDHRE